jgi:hypothetical protein
MTWALQEVVSLLRYTVRAAKLAATAESDPSRTAGQHPQTQGKTFETVLANFWIEDMTPNSLFASIANRIVGRDTRALPAV